MANKKPANISKNLIFESYLDENELNNGLEKDFIKGSLRLNLKNYKEAYVTHPKRDSDIFIFDKDINRALFDDIVILKIHNKSEWKVINESLFPIKNKDSPDDKVEFKTIKMLLKASPNVFKKFDWNITSLDLENNEDFNENCKDWLNNFQRTGKVVGIYQKMNSRYCMGFLKLPEHNDKSKPLKYARFSPIDSRIPRLAIPINILPTDFLKRPFDYGNVKFIAKIGDWNESESYPNGEISQCLKDLNMIDQETIGILTECGFSNDEFDDKVIASIPKIEITEADLKFRRDYRNVCVISIDPKTARDLDDALHIQMLTEKSEDGKNLWEVGVHIADVTYYVRPESEVDKEAQRRTTTVYMVHKAVPMLPRELCENQCSLNPGTDKLAYSVVFKITDDCEIMDTWIGRTIIRTASKLSYEDAQKVLDNPTKCDWNSENSFQAYEPFNANDVASSILNLNHLAVKMRKNRFDNGSLWINQPKLGFCLNDERNCPLGYFAYKLGPSNYLIEEWMLRANMSVAEFLHKHLPGKAFLRCHYPPTIQAINGLNKKFSQIGWKHLCIEKGTTEEFQDLMQSFPKDDMNYSIMMSLCSQVMQLAQYFCHNDESGSLIGCQHFALNVPLYTHFTSPIRRYPDIIVQRQLTEILMKMEYENNAEGDVSEKQEKLDWMASTTQSKECTLRFLNRIADLCNKKRKDAKTADESSIALFYSLFVAKCGSFTENASVVGLLDKAFDVYLTNSGFTRRVYLNQLDMRSSNFVKNKNKLTIYWNRDKHCNNQSHTESVTILNLRSCVDITVYATSENNSVPKIKVVLPNPGCKICQKSNNAELNNPRDISFLQAEMTCIDEDRLFSILDDI